MTTIQDARRHRTPSYRTKCGGRFARDRRSYRASPTAVVGAGASANALRVLGRPGSRRVSPEDAGAFLRAFRIGADLVADLGAPAALTGDPDTDFLVALARAHDADMIVAGDKDLLIWAEQGLLVVTPAAFERMLTAG